MDSDSRKKDKTIIQKKNEADRQKSRNLIKKRLGTGEGWILKIVERVDYAFFERLSLLNWLTRWRPEWYGNISVAESYVVGWLLLELVLFALLAMSPHFASQTFWIILGLVIMIYRWQNILTYWFHDHILTGRVSSPVRALILTLINVIEIVIPTPFLTCRMSL